jgi:uncharacterized membrane protein (UPF0127 family)
MSRKSNKNKYLGYISIFLIIAFAAAYIANTVSGHKPLHRKRQKVEVPFTKQGELQIIKSDGDTLNFDIEIADNALKTEQGLMYRSKMDDKNGMLFIFQDVQPRSFWMRNTRIGLDIIYADNNGKIVSMAKYAKPYDETSLPSNAPAKYVLEINDGLADKLGINVGDIIVWKRK